MRKVIVILLLAVLTSCGGPRKVGINLWADLKKPQGVSKEDYKRLSQVFPHIPVNVLLEVRDEDGKPKASQSRIVRPSTEGKFGAKFEQEVESDDTIRLVVYSEKIVNISTKTEETKFEDAREKNICVEEETPEKAGVEYVCRWDTTSEVNFSQSVYNYLKIREKLSSSAVGEGFCDIYSESMRLIENLEEEVKDLARNDIAEIYNDFNESKWEKYRAGLAKIDEKNFSAAKNEFEDIVKLQCLPSDLLTLSKKNLYLSEIQKRFSTSKDTEFCSVYSWAIDFAEKSEPKIKGDLVTAVEGNFKEFLSKKRERYSELREKVEKIRDYRGVKLELETEEFKSLGCLPDDFHNSIAKLSNLCDSLKIFDEAVEKERRGDFIGAAKRVKDAIDITPDFLEGIIKVADVYFSLKMYDDAREYYQKALQLKNDSLITEKLGDTFYIMKDYESSLSEYKKAIDMSKEKEKSSPLGKTGKALLALSKYQEAVGYLKEAIRIAQKSSENAAEYLTLYGNALKSLERYDEAISSYEEAIKSDRDYAPAYKELSFLLADIGKYDDAEVKFEKLMFLDSHLRREPDVIIKYAETLEKLGKKDLAVKEFEKAELSSPSNAYLKYKVAVFYSNKEGYEKAALSKFKDAIKLEPKNLDYKLELARFYTKIGIPEGAKAELSDILKIDPQNEKAKTMYFESSVASLKGSLSKLRLLTKDIEILDSSLSRMSWESKERIFSTTGISKDMFDKISLYQKIAVLTYFMDKTFENPNRKNALVLEQITTKYLELIPDIPLSLAKKLASISSANFGLK